MSSFFLLFYVLFIVAHAVVNTIKDESGWKLVGTSATTPTVRTYQKPYPGTKLVAFRGIVILDTHISQAMGLFCDFTLSYQWVDMLQSIQALSANSSSVSNDNHLGMGIKEDGNAVDYMDCRPHGATDVVHQVVKLPWPLSNREIVLQRHWDYQAPSNVTKDEDSVHEQGTATCEGIHECLPSWEVVGEGDASEDVPGTSRQYRVHGTVTVRYHSVTDDRVPIITGTVNGRSTVRAESPHTLWRFQAVEPVAPAQGLGPDGSGSTRARARSPLTRVEVQVIVDSKGSVPVWLINQVQRRWPHTALAAFNRLVMATPTTTTATVTSSGGGSSSSSSSGVRPFLPVATW